MSRPTPWIEDAVTVQYWFVETGHKKNTLRFHFEVTNNTKKDWSIDEHSKITVFTMTEGGNLRGGPVTESILYLDLPVFLPAGETGLITITFPAEYPGKPLKAGATAKERKDHRKIVERWFAKTPVRGFVVFDSANHYKVRMLGGWHKSEESESNEQQ